MALRQQRVRREDNPPTEPGPIGSVTGSSTHGSEASREILTTQQRLTPTPGLPAPGYVYSGGYTPPIEPGLIVPRSTDASRTVRAQPRPSRTVLAPELAAERAAAAAHDSWWDNITEAVQGGANRWNNMVDTAVTGGVDAITPNVGVIERPVHGAVNNVLNTVNTAGAIANQVITNPIQSAEAVRHAATETGQFIYEHPGQAWDIAFESGRDYVTNPWNIVIDGGLLAASLYTGGGAGAGLVTRMAARTGRVLNSTRVGRQVVRGVGSAQRIRHATTAAEVAEGANAVYRPGRVMSAVDTALELQPRASSAVRTRLGLNEFGATSRARTALGNKIGTGNEGWRAAVGDWVRDSSYRPGSVSRHTGQLVGAPLSESAGANRLATQAWRTSRARELRAQYQFLGESQDFWSDPMGYAAEKGQNLVEDHPEVATQVGQAVMQNPRFQQEVGRAVGQGLDAVADAQQQGLSRLTEGIEDFKTQLPEEDEEKEEKKPKEKRQPPERRRLALTGYAAPAFGRAAEDRRRPRKMRALDPEEEVESNFFVTPSRRGSFYESASSVYGGR